MNPHTKRITLLSEIAACLHDGPAAKIYNIIGGKGDKSSSMANITKMF